MNHIYGYLCTLGVLLVVANGAYFMVTGKFTSFGLDRLAVALFRGIGSLTLDALRAIGNMLVDAIRGLFRRRNNNNNQQPPNVHVYHHYPEPPAPPTGD